MKKKFFFIFHDDPNKEFDIYSFILSNSKDDRMINIIDFLNSNIANIKRN